MKKEDIPFQAIDWNGIPKTEHEGEAGIAVWQTLQYSGLRVRIVELSKNNIADHWCEKGHIVHCLEGTLVSKLKNGEKFWPTAGMTYVVSDGLSSHLTISGIGAKLLVIDGDFLKTQ